MRASAARRAWCLSSPSAVPKLAHNVSGLLIRFRDASEWYCFQGCEQPEVKRTSEARPGIVVGVPVGTSDHADGIRYSRQGGQRRVRMEFRLPERNAAVIRQGSDDTGRFRSTRRRSTRAPRARPPRRLGWCDHHVTPQNHMSAPLTCEERAEYGVSCSPSYLMKQYGPRDDVREGLEEAGIELDTVCR